MRIEQLKPSQRVAGRWLAVLDDGRLLRLGEGEVVDFALYAGRELDEDELAALEAATHSAALRRKGLELLSRKPQSRREFSKKLAEWGADEAECEQLCTRMEELGYLDDARYAQTVVSHYAAKGYGAAKLRDELYRRGVAREFWAQALAQAEDTAPAIDAFLRKKLGDTRPDRAELKRVSDALARRGFSWSEIKEGLSRYGAQVWEED